MSARAERIFAQLADLPEDARAVALRDACGADRALRDEVERLLRLVDDDALGFLARPAVTREGEDPPPPSHIGRYRVLRKLGAGTSGVVFEAEQLDPKRKVAIKLLRAALLDAGEIARFRFEAEVLARLRHPGIATVFEIGDCEGPIERSPYIVMELVDGVPLDAYAHAAGLDTRGRLALMLRICDAVGYAHRSGVIHRDLKPANVLVTDGGQPKLVDFGIARIVDGSGLTLTVPTMLGLSGTLAYMSPEHAGGGTVDTRTDVYSLGVMLYELLAGRPPLDLAHAPLPEAARRIADVEPVPLGQLEPSLAGDLTTLVATAIAKSPDRRYASVAAFADDIQRHLDDRPILARRPTAGYVLRKFARRHRAAVVASCVGLVALVAGAVGTVRFAVEAHAQAASATRRLTLAHESLEFLFEEVIDGLTSYPGTSELQAHILDRGARYYSSLAEEAPHDFEGRRPLALAFERLAEVRLVRGDLPEARAAAERFHELVATAARDLGMSPELRLMSFRSESLLYRLGDTARRAELEALSPVVLEEWPNDREALLAVIRFLTFDPLEPDSEEFRLAETLCDRVLELDPGNPAALGRRCLLDQHRADRLLARGRLDESRQVRRASLDRMQHMLERDPTNPAMLNNTIHLRRTLAEVELRLGNRAEALEQARLAVESARELVRLEPTGQRFRVTLATALTTLADSVDGERHSDRFDAFAEAADALAGRVRDEQAAGVCVSAWLDGAVLGVVAGRPEDVEALRDRAVSAVAGGGFPPGPLLRSARALLRAEPPSPARRRFLAALLAALANDAALSEEHRREALELEAALR